MKLIPDWREAWRYFSVQCAALLAFVSACYDYLPDVQAYLPEGWVKWMALVIIVARLIRQGADKEERRA
jgi:hypothetical protein